MRGLLVFACRAFPPDHRARSSAEFVDTALSAAEGSTWRATCEASSLVVAGLRQRLRVEAHRSPRDGLAFLAGVLAVVNLAVALAGISLSVDPPRLGILMPVLLFFRNPYLVRGWWITFSIAAAAIVLGLVLGNRRLALGAALANLGIVAYEAFYFRPLLRGHLNAFTYAWKGFPLGREWLAPAVVLALATAGAPLRRLPLWRLAPALAVAVLIVVFSRQILDDYFFLLWPFAAIAALGLVFGWLSSRLAVVAVGASLVAAPSVVSSLTTTSSYRAPVFWMAALTLVVAFFLPLAHLTRRRLT